MFAAVGLAGSVLVVRDTVDAALNPACYARPPVGPAAPSPPSVADVLRAAYAGVPITDVDSVSIPERPGDPWVLRAEDDAGDLEIFVRYDAGAVLCARVWADSLVGAVTTLHTSLLIPFDWRHEAVALLAGGDLVLVLAGLVLYVRQRRNRPRRMRTQDGAAARGRSGPRWPWVHSAVGSVAGVLLLVPVVTGAAMAVPHAARGLLALALPFADPPPRIKPAPRAAEPIGPDAAVAAAVAAIPGGSPRALVLPPAEDLPYRVFVRPPGDGRTRSGGSTSVLVGPSRAEVVAVVNPLQALSGDRAFAARFPLHTGEMWHVPGQAVAFLTGLAPAALLGTAAAAWLARRRRRRALKENLEPHARSSVKSETAHTRNGAPGLG